MRKVHALEGVCLYHLLGGAGPGEWWVGCGMVAGRRGAGETGRRAMWAAVRTLKVAGMVGVSCLGTKGSMAL